MLLRADTNHEGGNVDGLSADGDVFLVDEHAGMMDRVGESALLDQGLKAALEELRGGQTEHIIEFALVVLEETKSDHSADEGLTY